MQNVSRFEGLLTGVMCTKARVVATEALSEHYRRIELQSEDGASLHGNPGDKLQVRVAPWTFRTFTPLAADTNTHLLCFRHDGESAADAAFAALRAGDRLELLGPRRSLPLLDLDGPLVLFGDETSIAVALALRTAAPTAKVILEADLRAETVALLERLALRDAIVVQRTQDDAHLTEVCEHLRAAPGRWVLTGKAQSLQRLRALLGADKSRIAKTKAYWSVGKRGLD